MLNGMASQDFAAALDRHVAWKLKCLDLKDGIFGKSIEALLPAEAKRAQALIGQRGLEVYCLSTSLVHLDVAEGEGRFRSALAGLDRVLETVRCAISVTAFWRAGRLRRAHWNWRTRS
jgi:hypothetical protein